MGGKFAIQGTFSSEDTLGHKSEHFAKNQDFFVSPITYKTTSDWITRRSSKPMLLSSSKLFLDITNTSSYITLCVFLLLNVVLRGKRSILISNSFTLPPFLSEKTIYHLASRHLSFVTTLCFVHCCQRSRGSLGKTNLFPLFHSFSAAASSRKICGEQNATAMAEVRYNSS